LPSTSAIFISRKIIGRLSVLNWDDKIKLGSLTASHKLMLIDHLRIINHHTQYYNSSFIKFYHRSYYFGWAISEVSLLTSTSNVRFFFVGQLPHSSLDTSHSKWVLDSGASHHISPNSSSFTFVSPSPSIPIMTIYGTRMPLVGVSSLYLICAMSRWYSTLSIIWKIRKIEKTRNSYLLLVEWGNRSRHLVFWTLGTLTGFRDRVWGLVA
jgi:hypothetical protein